MISSQQEQILVIPRTTIFSQQTPWHGLNNETTEHVINTITENQEYIQRSIAETDQSYKQIIPYMIFTFQNKYFVMQRKSTASEQRLANKLSIGIGGHIRQDDIQGKTIFNWAQREFEEEVSYIGSLNITTLGILNDDSNDVGKVHLGIVLLLKGDNSNIQIKSEHKSGSLWTKQECLEMIESFEAWSQLVINLLP